jgi:acetyltransferase
MLEKFLNPKSVAIIGAACEEGKVGHVILDNILEAGFKGSLYAVNPKTDEIHGVKSYPSILDIKSLVDLAVIVTPAKTVPSLIEQSGQKGVKAAIIISAGFKETSLEGAALEKEAVSVAKKYGLRLLGPNCLGLINAHTGLNASFTRVGPLQGNIAFISQSGALQTAILDWSRQVGLGFSKFISLGNKADLNEVDFLESLERDNQTDVICMYLEGVSNGRRFLKVAGRIALKKPLIVLKAGRTTAGAKAVSSHTGTLAGSTRAYTAAFTQAGVIQVDSLEQLFSYAHTLSCQPLPKGNKFGILTNAGGPAILASDFASKSALRVASLENKTVKALSSFLPAAANVYNPVDLLGDALADRYEKALELLEKDKNAASILAILTPQAMTEIEKTAKLLSKKSKNTKKPFIAAFMGGAEIQKAVEILKKNKIPNYIYPEDAVKAIGSLVTYSKIIKRPKAQYKKFEADTLLVKKIISKAQKEQRVNLSYLEANTILTAYGIEVPKNFLAKNEEEAEIIAEKIGYPIALKVVSPDILHKTDIGGVKLNLFNKEEVADGFQKILNNAAKFMPQANVEGILVQEMIKEGEETIVGISADPQFGPLVLFGLGGIYVEVLKDVSFRIAPLSIMDVKKMLGEVKSYLLLTGARGRNPGDVKAVEEAILRVSQLVTDIKDIVEMDINPLMVKDEGEGAIAADVRISIRL